MNKRSKSIINTVVSLGVVISGARLIKDNLIYDKDGYNKNGYNVCNYNRKGLDVSEKTYDDYMEIKNEIQQCLQEGNKCKEPIVKDLYYDIAFEKFALAYASHNCYYICKKQLTDIEYQKIQKLFSFLKVNERYFSNHHANVVSNWRGRYFGNSHYVYNTLNQLPDIMNKLFEDSTKKQKNNL